MALSNMRNANAIGQSGSEVMQMVALTTLDAPTGDYYTLPIVASSELSDETASVDFESEGGVIRKRDGARSVSMTATFQQTDLKTLKLGLETKGQYYRIVKEMNQEPIDGKHAYLCIAKASFNPTYSLSKPGSEVSYTLNVENNSSLVTMDLTAFTDDAFAVTLSCSALPIPSGQRYEYYEQAGA